MEINLRAATKDDYPAIDAIWSETDEVHHAALPDIFGPPTDPARPRATILALLAHPDHHLLVAERDGAIVGCIHVSVRESQAPMVPSRFAVIEAVGVRQEHHGGGVGRLLMLAAQRWAREQAATDIWLNVWTFNAAAIGLYEALGYETLSQRMRLDLGE